jgi:hypothetical protein
MSHIKSVNIPKPCHETWQAMASVPGGRHCQSCCRTVTDFTVMTNEQVIAYLSSHQDICGRLYKRQIEQFNRPVIAPVKRTSFFNNYRIAAIFAGIVAFTKASAHEQPAQPVKTEQQAQSVKSYFKVSDTAKYINIQGIILSADDNTPVPGATVRIKGTSYAVATNSSGRFTIRVSVDKKKIVISAIGYEPQEIKIKRFKKSDYKIRLLLNAAVLGGIAFVTI